MTQRIVSLRDIRLGCITNCITDNSRKCSYFSQTNSILFSKVTCLKKVNISFTGYSIKQHDTVEYLACQRHSKLSGEALPSKILPKLNPKLKFLYRKSIYLTSTLRKLLSNALIQPRFALGCSSGFPFLKEYLKIKLQKAENKYIRFCLNLPLRFRINP